MVDFIFHVLVFDGPTTQRMEPNFVLMDETYIRGFNPCEICVCC